MRFFYFFKQKRPIKLDLVTIPLLSVGITALSIIFFMDYASKKGMTEISESMTRQVSQGVVAEVGALIKQTELLVRAIEAGVLNKNDLFKPDSHIGNYLLDILKIGPFMSRIRIATEDGNSISAIDLSFTSSESSLYIQKTIPEGAKYVVQIGETVQSISKLTSEYKGTDLEVISRVEQNEFPDPRKEGWYTQTENWPRTYWELNSNGSLTERSLVVTVPLWNLEHKFIGVVSIDLSINQLSNFISYQQIGLSGEVFILNERGNFVFPLFHKVSSLHQTLIEKAYEFSKETNNQDFFISENGKKYLFSFINFPLSPETRWFIVTMIPFEDFFKTMIQKQYEAFYIAFGIFALFGILAIFSSRHISIPIVKLAHQVERIQSFDFTEEPSFNSRISEIDKLDTSIASMRTALKAFGLYVPKEIVRTLIQQGNKIGVGGKKAKLTIFFSDIANFTPATESIEIEQLFNLLSDYFNALSTIILELEGTIDKYIGDSIMAFWGAPKAVEDRQDKACLAALRCQKICQSAENQNRPVPWKTRIGIHSGEVIVGNIGTPERMNYTAIGDIVNTSSRMEGVNKEYGTSILISETVHEAIGGQFLSRPIDFVAVKGKKNRILLYELVGAFHLDADLIPTEEELFLCKNFTEGYFLFHEGKKKEAEKLFMELQKKFPGDRPTQIYLERIKNESLN